MINQSTCFFSSSSSSTFSFSSKWKKNEVHSIKNGLEFITWTDEYMHIASRWNFAIVANYILIHSEKNKPHAPPQQCFHLRFIHLLRFKCFMKNALQSHAKQNENIANILLTSDAKILKMRETERAEKEMRENENRKMGTCNPCIP